MPLMAVEVVLPPARKRDRVRSVYDLEALPEHTVTYLTCGNKEDGLGPEILAYETRLARFDASRRQRVKVVLRIPRKGHACSDHGLNRVMEAVEALPT